MAIPPLRPTKAQAEELAVVCGKGPERLRRLVSRLEELHVTISPTKLREIISQEVAEDASAVVRQLITWASFARQNYTSPSEVVSGLSIGLKQLEGWGESNWTNWEACKAEFEHLLRTVPVKLSAKALDLSFEFVNYCISARIVTDARPVFSVTSLSARPDYSQGIEEIEEDGPEVVGAVVSQTLQLEYATRDGRHSISVALDREDLNRLQRECQRALRKGEILITLVREKWGLEAFAVGEENYGIL